MRRTQLPMIYGDYLPLHADKDVYAFARVYLGQWIICAFSNSTEERQVVLTLPEDARLEGLTPVFGNEAQINGNQVTITLQPLNFEIIK